MALSTGLNKRGSPVAGRAASGANHDALEGLRVDIVVHTTYCVNPKAADFRVRELWCGAARACAIVAGEPYLQSRIRRCASDVLGSASRRGCGVNRPSASSSQAMLWASNGVAQAHSPAMAAPTWRPAWSCCRRTRAAEPSHRSAVAPERPRACQDQELRHDSASKRQRTRRVRSCQATSATSAIAHINATAPSRSSRPLSPPAPVGTVPAPAPINSDRFCYSARPKSVV